MIYQCTSAQAQAACERTFFAGDDTGDGQKYCPVCNSEDPECFYLSDDGDCVGCSECINTVEWSDFD